MPETHSVHWIPPEAQSRLRLKSEGCVHDGGNVSGHYWVEKWVLLDASGHLLCRFVGNSRCIDLPIPDTELIAVIIDEARWCITLKFSNNYEVTHALRLCPDCQGTGRRTAKGIGWGEPCNHPDW